MNIELKNIQIFDRMSEETTAFHASLYIDGERVGIATNGGTGGSTEYRVDDHKLWPLIKLAEDYCIGLPPLKYPGLNDVPMNLEGFIDQFIEEALIKRQENKFRLKLKKDQLKAILIGNNDEYRKISWPKKGTRSCYPISDMLKSETGKNAIKKAIDNYKLLMAPTDRILNTNIPNELL